MLIAGFTAIIAQLSQFLKQILIVGYDHAAFTCTGLAATQSRLEAMDIPFERAVVPATRCVQLFLQDPAGNGVELNFPDGEA